MPSPYYVDDGRSFLQRQDTMSLDTIHPSDVPRGQVRYPKDELASLTTQDIKGAMPEYKPLRYLHKPDLCVGNTDPGIEGTHARTYYPMMDRRPRDLSLTTADIEYAQPKPSGHKSNRHTDPVCPRYELPSSMKRPITPPRWNGRHTNDTSDIEFSSPKKLIPDRNYIRDPNDSSDIEYTSCNYEERVKRADWARQRADRSLNVTDICGNKKVQPRCSNPLNPVYKVPSKAITSLHAKFAEERGMSFEHPPAEERVMGDVPGSKPRKLQWDNGEPHFSLMREDIAGAVPQRWIGAVPMNIYDPPEVKPVISFHEPDDIPGAQVGTLKKGLEGSIRAGSTNPLNPRYQMLDGRKQTQSLANLNTTVGAERGGRAPTHPLMQSAQLGKSQSMPSLKQTMPTLHPQEMLRSAGTPSGGVRKDKSAATLRPSPTVQFVPDTGRSNRTVSSPNSPSSQASLMSPARRF